MTRKEFNLLDDAWDIMYDFLYGNPVADKWMRDAKPTLERVEKRLRFEVATPIKRQKVTLPAGWPRVSDLPGIEQAPFNKWLDGQTRPWLTNVKESEQDGYYADDYERWKAKKPVID